MKLLKLGQRIYIVVKQQYLNTRRLSTAKNQTTTRIEKTALYNFHVQNRGKIVNFGGYALPVQYATESITTSHLYTRRFGSIFDVSHMLQTYVRGSDAIPCIESICTADIAGAVNDTGCLTVFTNDHGGILDDLIIVKINERLLYIVSNASMKRQDMDIMQNVVQNYKSQGKDIAIDFLTPADQSLIAVQGPKAVKTLQKLLPTNFSLENLYFMNTTVTTIAGVPDCRITRCGYTGEDGVEISVSSEQVEHITEALLNADTGERNHQQLKMAGLGARDSLRLEAGLCLYGNDIDAKTTPVEAGLAWLVAKRRRTEANFPGAHNINTQLKSGIIQRRIGLQMLGNNVPPARANTTILHNDKVVGKVTSGTLSPNLNTNIAMGYIAETFKSLGTALKLQIRNKLYDCVVVKLPFVKTNYHIKHKK